MFFAAIPQNQISLQNRREKPTEVGGGGGGGWGGFAGF